MADVRNSVMAMMENLSDTSVTDFEKGSVSWYNKFDSCRLEAFEWLDENL